MIDFFVYFHKSLKRQKWMFLFEIKRLLWSALQIEFFELYFLQPVLGGDLVLSGHLTIPQGWPLNPLSPNSDQDQFSPNNIHTLSRDRLWELIKWSTKRKCLDLLSNSLSQFFKEMYGDQFGEFVCWYWGLKG